MIGLALILNFVSGVTLATALFFMWQWLGVLLDLMFFPESVAPVWARWQS